MRHIALFAALCTLLLTGCTSTLPTIDQRPVALIDWVDFVQFNGTTYLASHGEAGRALEEADLGPEFARVQFKLAENVNDPGYQSKDGDAAFLERGTSVHTVRGYQPQFRLAAVRDGQIILYEADTNPNAKQGADLLDLRDKVASIGVVSAEDGTTELGVLNDPQQVAALVELVLAAPVDQSQPPQDDAGQNYMIVFHFKDATATSRMYWSGSGEMTRGIRLPEEFQKAIQAAL
ncbi:MAG TPA: hypothetical protein VFZ66_03750 [Herpetosiphonaceae bacterium]